jgi:hypothetical protein
MSKRLTHMHQVEPWGDFKDRCIATQLPPHQPVHSCCAGCGDTSAASSPAASGSPNKRLHQSCRTAATSATCAPPCHRQHTRGIATPAHSRCSCQVHLLRPVNNQPAPHSIRQLTSLLANVLAVAGHVPMPPAPAVHHPPLQQEGTTSCTSPVHHPVHRKTHKPWPGMATPHPRPPAVQC